jgi:hypothetical protein
MEVPDNHSFVLSLRRRSSMLKLDLAFVSCMVLLAPAVGMAGTIVVPNAETSSAGNAAEGIPVSTGVIFQELFAPGQFTGPIDITELSLRAAPGTGPVDETVGALSVYLSTSSNYPNSTSGPLMSTTFANNIGPDNTLVFSGTNTTISGSGCSGPGVCPFDISLDFTTPFDYNPANGSLLLEFVETNLVGVSGSFDGEGFSAPGGSVAQVSELGSTTATTGSLSYGGLITEFTFTPVPEPASWTMMAVSVAALLFGSVRRSS